MLKVNFLVLVLSMSIVLVTGINTTSINIALDGSELTELWVTKVTGFSSQYNTGRYGSCINIIRYLSSQVFLHAVGLLTR